MPLHVSVNDHTLHVAREDKCRNTHVLKCINHTDEEILLPGVREKLYIPLPAIMTNHSEASNMKLGTIWIKDLCKPLVHLERFSWPGHIASTMVALWRKLLALGRQKMFVRSNVFFYDCCAALISCLLKPI